MVYGNDTDNEEDYEQGGKAKRYGKSESEK